jgi:hypothetical protein
MTTSTLLPDRSGPVRSQPGVPYASPGMVSTTGASNAAGIVSLACAVSAVLCAAGPFLWRATPSSLLVPIASIAAAASGIIALVRKDRPRWPAVTGLIAGGLMLVTTVLFIGFALIALAHWEG